MIASTRIFQIAAFAAALSTPPLVAATLDLAANPDSLVLRDGTVVKGLIVRSVRGDVTIQTAGGEENYTRDQVSRVHDVPGEGSYLTDIERKGDLPPWRTIVNDLRHSDGVRSFAQIPATVIDAGNFKNVPYLSFRVNGNIELNIYGDPEDPAGIEMGIYGPRQGDKATRRLIREFLVSYLNTRAEIAAVYELDEDGGQRDAGAITIEYSPADGEDSYNAWWLSVYNKKHLADARLDDAEYAKLTRPMDTVVEKDGQVRANAWTDADAGQSLRLQQGDGSERLFVRGFYRDKNGDFRLVTGQ